MSAIPSLVAAMAALLLGTRPAGDWRRDDTAVWLVAAALALLLR